MVYGISSDETIILQQWRTKKFAALLLNRLHSIASLFGGDYIDDFD